MGQVGRKRLSYQTEILGWQRTFVFLCHPMRNIRVIGYSDHVRWLFPTRCGDTRRGATEKREKNPASHLITSPAKNLRVTRSKQDLITPRTGRPCESSQSEADDRLGLNHGFRLWSQKSG
jgi:hypothetical protein